MTQAEPTTAPPPPSSPPPPQSQSNTHPPPSALSPSTVPLPLSAWHTPGPASSDFRSDVVTTPTATMLRAIELTTLLDDVFAEDPTTLSLESYIASITSHEAALLVLSGTMGNQVALRTHLTQPPHSVLAHHKAHIIAYEAGGVASLSQAMVTGVVPRNGLYLTVEDVERNVVLGEGEDVHACPTRVISLENTLAGTVTPLEEVRRISRFARSKGIKMHLDGARLWEVVASGAGGLHEFTECFDSVSLCFSKGLGAPIGSIVVGSREFVKRARWVRKSIGGGTRQAGVISAAARVAVEETFGTGPNGENGRLRESHRQARRIAGLWEQKGGRLQRPTETNMVWFDLERVGITNQEFAEVGKRNGLRLIGGRLVVHYQISDDAIARLEKVMDEVLKDGKTQNGNTEANGVGEKVSGQA